MLPVCKWVALQLQRAEERWKGSGLGTPPVILVLQQEDMTGLLELAIAAAEAVERTGGSQPTMFRKGAGAGRPSNTRHGSKQHAPAQHLQHQHEGKLSELTKIAQQRVLQSLPRAIAADAQQHWKAAAEAVSNWSSQTDSLTGFAWHRSAAGAVSGRLLAASPEWIAGCWEAAQLMPLDSAHGCIEVTPEWC